MPELPEVEALAHHLREYAVGTTVTRVDVASLTVLKTVQPAVSTLHGCTVTGAGRHGKFLTVYTDGPALVMHLARAGWLRWSDSLAPAAPRPGKGPIALRVHLSGGAGFDLTEAGTQKRLAVYIVADAAGVAELPGIRRLGPDALALTRDELGEVLRGRTERLKTVLTDQTLIAGVGNAYSDEVLHAARLSPYAAAGRLPEDALDRLHDALRRVLLDAVARSVGQDAARLKGEKRAGLAVHARAGLPCPVCGDTVREVSFADRAFQYCPTCQTAGKPLADRRLSRLIR
ncbi:MAG TPA: DNA-formamidopyrimidine glycosylase family protein [Pseudonocardiaceae bacterium]|jgi:formamidopyrimidine-DNA glycosylase|nr:DNA-formamidopyrimidine glycosylase family protein [Pseudonocardiaceae bacterium]